MDYIPEGMCRVCWCPECRLFVTRELVNGVQTLVDDHEPFDSNDTFHWMCVFCGYSDVPATWNSFAGYPTPVEFPDDEFPEPDERPKQKTLEF